MRTCYLLGLLGLLIGLGGTNLDAGETDPGTAGNRWLLSRLREAKTDSRARNLSPG